MEDSESQFQELLAHFAARVNKALAAREAMVLCLFLRADGSVDVAAGIANTANERAEVLNAMQASAKTQVSDESIEAICIAYPDSSNQAYVALLENRDNYCAKVIMPIVMHPAPELDFENIDIQDGDVYVFPYVDAE
ncbi:hypothetical protein LK540_20815 [Massilia sp. IC2-278]|uniref:hypothetical protein n=1 Tax=Massilia sp. IC2-278 TaxID=2887200 RepID=UPI001E29A0D3|nr:hypothetical protein [Massilia sp. IC2-278]MCC2962879.1 hypothetical protein [Massilia sp. IC2-278]